MKKFERTHYCGRLRESNIDEAVALSGWVQRRRDLGGVIFLDLRDKTGITQIILDQKDLPAEMFNHAEGIRSEYVIQVKGLVEKRSEDTINPLIPTGKIDVRANELTILSKAHTPPFMIEENSNVREELRLKYRFLDLRRPDILRNLKLRQQVTNTARTYLEHKEFMEVETPILSKSTPEGARDFLVPSRIKKGTFYGLPQSPQIYKQLLMVGGIDRYFQVAKCFRDEDLRADRQPEFTQIDMELSFVDEEDIIELLEGLFADLFQKVKGITLKTPFDRITYAESMSLYGVDKPDLRFGFPMIDLTEICKTCEFEVFRSVVNRGGIVKALNIKGGASFTRTQIEALTHHAMSLGGKGMAWIAVEADGSLKSVITKFFKEADIEAILEKTEAKPGDLLIFSADKKELALSVLGSLRLMVGDMMGLRNDKEYAFVVVTDFPLLEWSEEEKRYVAMHHPFTMPKDEDLELFETAPEKVRAKAYDIVLNGVELGSGSIRIHDSSIQSRMFKLLGFSEEEAKERFGFLLSAFEYGVPPHGGFAFGLDRLIMLMVGAESIRDVIAFPKMKDASCAMTQSPSEVNREQLDELSIYLEGTHAPKHEAPQMTHEVIEHVAKLSRIELDEAEKETLTSDLMKIIAFADQLSEVDTSSVHMKESLSNAENVFRVDRVIEFEDQEGLLKNAAQVTENCIFVPKTVE